MITYVYVRMYTHACICRATEGAAVQYIYVRRTICVHMYTCVCIHTHVFVERLKEQLCNQYGFVESYERMYTCVHICGATE